MFLFYTLYLKSAVLVFLFCRQCGRAWTFRELTMPWMLCFFPQECHESNEHQRPEPFLVPHAHGQHGQQRDRRRFVHGQGRRVLLIHHLEQNAPRDSCRTPAGLHDRMCLIIQSRTIKSRAMKSRTMKSRAIRAEILVDHALISRCVVWEMDNVRAFVE